MQSSPGGGWGAGPGPSCDVNLTLRRQPSASPADAGSGSPSREGGPAASRPAPGRLGRWARGGRYINPERDGREAGGEEAGRLRQTPQLKSESELAVRAAPRRPTTRRTVPGDGDPRGAPSLYSPRLHPRPAATFPCKPQTRGHRSARSAQEGVLEGGRVGPAGDTPPPGNSLVWIFLDSYFGLCCCFPGEGGLQGERGSIVSSSLLGLRSPRNSERSRRRGSKQAEGEHLPGGAPSAAAGREPPFVCGRGDGALGQAGPSPARGKLPRAPGQPGSRPGPGPCPGRPAAPPRARPRLRPAGPPPAAAAAAAARGSRAAGGGRLPRAPRFPSRTSGRAV